MNIINEQTELVDVRALKPHPKNPNQGSADLIAESIQTNGWYGQIIAQRSTGHILVGHHRLQAAQQLGATEVPVTWVDVDNTRALKIMLADNATAAAAHRDEQSLADLLSELQLTDTLTGTGYADADLDALIASIADNAPTPEPLDAPEPQVDRAEELREKWQTERGQLWTIPSRTVPGKAHRLLCGDSTSAEDVTRLMDGQKADMVWTDPPYGVAYVGKTKDALTIENDDLDEGKLLEFLRQSLGLAAKNTKPGGSWYVAASPGPLHLQFAVVLHELGIWRQTLQWVKSAFVMGRSDYHYRHEPIFYGWVPGAPHYFVDDRTQDSVLEFDKPNANRLHPTMKPVELVERCLANSSIRGSRVLEPFCGSGTTMLAAEKQGRVCNGIEYDPKYIAVILERLSGMGLAPELQPAPHTRQVKQA